ncbi:MAG: DUF1465 family protein [Nitratireductor sp.]|nr:DUF1465 family protein [Nitratireductor sp.]
MNSENDIRIENTIKLGERFANSGKFRELFRSGMTLVEESATFLDGPGRKAARDLSRQSSLLYGAESMRLTTRLMQLASWLLLQRAASEGEMTRQQLIEEKSKVRLENIPQTRIGAGWELLPPEFVDLVERSLMLEKRIVSLDSELYGERVPASEQPDNPVDQQINLLSTAFGAVRQK